MSGDLPLFPHIGIVILAAGASRRLGHPKQLIRFQGENLVQRAARTALSTGCRPVLIVVGANAEQVRQELPEQGLILVDNPRWEQGMSTSLRAGLHRALQENGQLEALIFLVVDQPFLEPALLRQMIERYDAERPPVVAAAYNGRPGVPALFDRALFGELDRLQGDQGARPLFQRYRDLVCLLPFPLGEFDIDTPEDFERFQRKGY